MQYVAAVIMRAMHIIQFFLSVLSSRCPQLGLNKIEIKYCTIMICNAVAGGIVMGNEAVPLCNSALPCNTRAWAFGVHVALRPSRKWRTMLDWV